MATTLAASQISITFSSSTILPNQLRKNNPRPITIFPSFSITPTNSFFHLPICRKLRVYEQTCKGSVFQGGVLVERNGLMRNCNRWVVLVRSNNLGFGFNGGGGKGGGGDDGTSKIVGNLVLAIGLTYLTLTGQLGWILDAVVSIGLALIVVPVVGVVAFLWWAGRDIVQGTCPNCGNELQLFKSTLNNESQQCPFCSETFSVVGDEFVSDSMSYTNQSTTFGQAFDDVFPRSNKGTKKEKKLSKSIVDTKSNFIRCNLALELEACFADIVILRWRSNVF